MRKKEKKRCLEISLKDKNINEDDESFILNLFINILKK